MPIKIPNRLPAKSVLDNENIFVMTEYRALHQDIRPLKIIILNLMPTKIETETQLLRLLGNSPLQVELELLQTYSYTSKNTSAEHLVDFYKVFPDIKHNKYDGMIITGAPVENLPFKEVEYWDELCEIMEWSKHNVYSTLHICWGAQAGLYYHYGIDKLPLKEKLTGVFEHKVLSPHHPLMRGFDEKFLAPHSRHTDVKADDILKHKELELLSVSDIAGVYVAANRSGRHFFVTGHSEYDRETLQCEYERDKAKGLETKIPFNYFPKDDPKKTPPLTWRAHASLLYANWLNYFVYQTTPYDTNKIK